MLERIFSVGIDLLAMVLPVSIAATNIVFFPLIGLWVLGGGRTLRRWPPTWGGPEKWFLIYLGVSLVSAMLSVDPAHSLIEIKNKDFYILIALFLGAFIEDRGRAERLLKLFMRAALATAIWGIIQYAVGVNAIDKHDGTYLHLPAVLAHWPQPLLNLLAMINGRVLGTRGHPLAYAECLLFNWSFALCFVMVARRREVLRWMVYLVAIGAALLVSQSRGPWIAAAVVALLCVVSSESRRAWRLIALGAFFLTLFVTLPVFRDRAASILDRSHHSNRERLHMWRAGWQMWKAHPLFGVGPGSVKAMSASVQSPEEQAWGSWGHLHSTYVNTLAERGLLGLVAFIMFVGVLCQELWLALDRARGDPWASAVYKACLLGIVGFLIGGLTETTYNTAGVMMTFYFVTGLGLALSRHDQTAHRA